MYVVVGILPVRDLYKQIDWPIIILLGDFFLSRGEVRKAKEFYNNVLILKNLDEISIVDFDHTEVVRHPLVTKIVKAYDDVKND